MEFYMMFHKLELSIRLLVNVVINLQINTFEKNH